MDSLLRQIDEKSKSVSSTNSTIDTTKVCMDHRIFTASTSLHTCGSINRYIHFTDGNESWRACRGLESIFHIYLGDKSIKKVWFYGSATQRALLL